MEGEKTSLGSLTSKFRFCSKIVLQILIKIFMGGEKSRNRIMSRLNIPCCVGFTMHHNGGE